MLDRYKGLGYIVDKKVRKEKFLTSKIRVLDMSDLVKHSEYEVEDGKTIKVTVPIQWLRDFTKTGDMLGLFEDSEHRLIIEKIPLPKEVS